MPLDPASRWLVEVRDASGVTARFDTPRCAFAQLVAKGGALYARGYYTQTQLPETALVFAVGSDVLGPMGADLVPIEAAKGEMFGTDHHASRLLTRERITRQVLDAL